MNISPARTAAFDVLVRIENDNAFPSVLLPQFEDQLSTKDRALCHEIVLGVLRRQIYLDRVIDYLAVKPRMDIEVRVALRIGILQLLFFDKIPPYSAVNESVNLVQRAKKTSAKGLVNAVLRRVQREEVEFTYADEVERISVETSHPRWLIEKWRDEFGSTEAEDIAKANNSVPRIALRLTERSKKQGPAGADDWIESEFVDGCFFVEQIDSRILESANAGEIYFQDEASQMVASTLELDPDASFLDVCAAPGGKTTLIASRTENTGLIAAGDLHSHRIRLLKENCERQGVNVSVIQYDAEDALPFADQVFDTILIDAPCSGTGTIRHNPEIRYSLKPGDFDQLYSKQFRILTNASKVVKPGGRIYYSTCSIEIEENERVISAFLETTDDFRKGVPKILTGFLTEEGFARTYPHRDGLDGFFLAMLERVEKSP